MSDKIYFQELAEATKNFDRSISYNILITNPIDYQYSSGIYLKEHPSAEGHGSTHLIYSSEQLVEWTHWIDSSSDSLSD